MKISHGWFKSGRRTITVALMTANLIVALAWTSAAVVWDRTISIMPLQILTRSQGEQPEPSDPAVAGVLKADEEIILKTTSMIGVLTYLGKITAILLVVNTLAIVMIQRRGERHSGSGLVK